MISVVPLHKMACFILLANMQLIIIRNRKQVPRFYRVIETRVEVWENSEDRNPKYMFSISFRKRYNKKKENNLLTLIIKM